MGYVVYLLSIGCFAFGATMVAQTKVLDSLAHSNPYVVSIGIALQAIVMLGVMVCCFVAGSYFSRSQLHTRAKERRERKAERRLPKAA